MADTTQNASQGDSGEAIFFGVSTFNTVVQGLAKFALKTESLAAKLDTRINLARLHSFRLSSARAYAYTGGAFV